MYICTCTFIIYADRDRERAPEPFLPGSARAVRAWGRPVRQGQGPPGLLDPGGSDGALEWMGMGVADESLVYM